MSNEQKVLVEDPGNVIVTYCNLCAGLLQPLFCTSSIARKGSSRIPSAAQLWQFIPASPGLDGRAIPYKTRPGFAPNDFSVSNGKSTFLGIYKMWYYCMWYFFWLRALMQIQERHWCPKSLNLAGRNCARQAWQLQRIALPKSSKNGSWIYVLQVLDVLINFVPNPVKGVLPS